MDTLNELLNQDLFSWYLEYQKTDEFIQEATKQANKERAQRLILGRVGSRNYRLKWPNASSDRARAIKYKNQLFEQQNGLCYWCKLSLDNKFDVDHIVPITKGGETELNNLCASHPYCNRSKGIKSGYGLYKWTKRIKTLNQ